MGRSDEVALGGLLEREEELAAIDAALEETAAGPGGAPC